MDIYYPLCYNLFREADKMIAKYENKTLPGGLKVSAHKYRDLQNLPHWHMEGEIIAADCGSAEVAAGSSVYSLEPGKCMFIKSGEVHHIRSGSGSVISVIKIDGDLLGSAFPNVSPKNPLTDAPEDLFRSFDRLSEEISQGKKYCGIICDAIALELAAGILRLSGTETESVQNGASEKYKKLLKLISEKYAYITFDDAAEFMKFSKPYFSKYFNRMSGMTFTSYLNIIRIEKAVKLLNGSKLTVTEVAQRTGFCTIRSFNRVFKELTGFTPKSLPKDYVFIKAADSPEAERFDPTISEPAVV